MVKGVRQPGLALLFVAFGFQNQRLEAELVLQLLVPLLAQVGWRDDEDAPFALCPALGNHQARLNGLAQAHLVRQDHALRERAAEGKESRLDLVGVEVDPRIDQGGGQEVGGVPPDLP